MSKLNVTRSGLIYSNTAAGVEVYAGSIQPSGIPVAIKEQVHPDFPSANSSISEALGQAKLSHPNILTIYECYLEPLPPNLKSVIVVELMDHDLIAEIDRRKYYQEYWSEQELLTHMCSLVSALSYAQSKEISHRDIKPQNIFVTGTVVKIGDFGSMAQNVGKRDIGTIVGSPLFFSPEMKEAFRRVTGGENYTWTYDPYRSDVYSLGVTLLFMATLEPPLALIQVDALQQITTQLLATIGGYPTLQRWVGHMLVVSNGERPCFQTLEAWGGSLTNLEVTGTAGNDGNWTENYVQGYSEQGRNQEFNPTQQTYQPQPVSCEVCRNSFIPSLSHPSTVCSLKCSQTQSLPCFLRTCKLCSQQYTDSTWTLTPLPTDISPFSLISTDFCSLNCLRQFAKVSKSGKTAEKRCHMCNLEVSLKAMKCGHFVCEQDMSEFVFARQSVCAECVKTRKKTEGRRKGGK